MTNIFINNIDSKLLPIEGQDLEEKISFILRRIGIKKINSISCIYYISNEPLFTSEGKLISQIGNIKVLIGDHFPYILRQLATIGKITRSSVIVSNNLWEMYLSSYMKVFSYKNGRPVAITKAYPTSILGLLPDEIDYLNDYIFLQEKNSEDSLGKKKTIKILKEYGGLMNLYLQRDKIENKRTKILVNYQSKRIKFYLDNLNPIFLSPHHIVDDK